MQSGSTTQEYAYVKPSNKTQMLGTHIGFEINTLKFSQ